MSWQAYVDTNLLGSGQISQAGIYGAQGGQWAASSGFNVTPAELQAIQQGFSDSSTLQANGVRVNNIKYMFLRSDDRSIYGKKGNGGVVIVKTIQAILVGIYDENSTPGNATKVVEGLADYLISVNY
ncbi:profilin, required for normal timing of actin polymerization in response to thermal stress [Umbelopsis sp. WA50703]